MLKIAITGPESTGKSALCEVLAKHYKTLWVPEFARTYLDGKTPPYKPADLDAICEGQIFSENQLEKSANGILFSDTEMTVMKIWSEHAFGNSSPTILELYQKQQYDLYLLTNIDLPWEMDPLREHPHLRQYFFDWYKKELVETNRNFVIISGFGESRLQHAIQAIDAWLI